MFSTACFFTVHEQARKTSQRSLPIEGEAIENELIYGSVSGKKSNEDGEDLGGVLIDIFKTRGGVLEQNFSIVQNLFTCGKI